MEEMKITYAITTHNEGEVIETLVASLINSMDRSVDEILIVDDYSTDKDTIEVLDMFKINPRNIQVLQHALNKDFAAHKNFMTYKSSGDFIFNIDADEFPSDYLLANIKFIILENPLIDIYWLPRINVVEGITDEDIKEYGWQINEKQYINFPDYQGRIYRKNSNIHWQGNVHEKLAGYKQFAYFPAEERFCLYHLKQIEKQRAQNDFYIKIKAEELLQTLNVK
jgi:glycosyltransferase involved in cell wall biosynthesis